MGLRRAIMEHKGVTASVMLVGALSGSAIGHEYELWDQSQIGRAGDFVGEATVGAGSLALGFGKAGISLVEEQIPDHRVESQPWYTPPPPTPSTATSTPSAKPSQPKVSAISKELSCINKWSVEKRIGQLLAVSAFGDALDITAPIFNKYGVGTIMLRTSPANPHDGSIKKFKAAQDIEPLISVDEEGGDDSNPKNIVQRFRKIGKLPSAETVANTMTPAEAQNMIAAHGEVLKEIGIDQTYGTVADRAQGKNPLGDRVFSSDASVVTKFSLAYDKGWQQANILPTLKHWPGGMEDNTDNAVAKSPAFSILQKFDMGPYKAADKANVSIMISNTIIPGLSGGQPASLSRAAVTDELRGREGYKDSLVVTDALNAEAIKYPLPQAVELAIRAGNDQALFVVERGQLENTLSKVVSWQVDAVNAKRISKSELNTHVLHVLGAKGVSACG